MTKIFKVDAGVAEQLLLLEVGEREAQEAFRRYRVKVMHDMNLPSTNDLVVFSDTYEYVVDLRAKDI